MVPYSHDPPGHTCGLPCCSEDLQVQLHKQRQPRSCIGIQDQDTEHLQQNFTFKGKLKRQPTLENGFFSVQEQKEGCHRPIPEFGSVRASSVPAMAEKQKKFLKGREITLPQSDDPNATQRLYLEDFNFGESDDFLDPDDTSSTSEIEYYISVKSPLDPERGVPYDPKELDKCQIYPWDLLKEMKDNMSSKTSSDRTEDSSSSNYYDVLQIPEEPEEKDLTVTVPTKHPADKPLPPPPHGDIPPPLPPKLPVQNRFNHPPLPKDITDYNKTEGGTKPTEIANSDKNVDKGKPNESVTGTSKYNIYSSVCSLTGIASAASKEALEKYRSMSREECQHRNSRQDIRDVDFTGSQVYLVHDNKRGTKKSDSLPKKVTINEKCEEIKPGKKAKDCKAKIVEKDEEKVKLLDSRYDYDDEDDDSGGMINPIFKNVNVEGKVLGSRNSVRAREDTSSQDKDVEDVVQMLDDLDTYDTKSEEETEMLKLLKERLRDLDDSLEQVNYDEMPVTLIL